MHNKSSDVPVSEKGGIRMKHIETIQRKAFSIVVGNEFSMLEKPLGHKKSILVCNIE